ncbi:unknown [Clostridium sp. CAG:557]|nr:unknown [Clostridium sp. CAG:557]
MLVKKDDKGKDFLKDKNLDKINGGKNTTYNKEVQGNGNIVGVNANFEQMLGAIDKMNKSGKLDYLKKK